jgi:hypothetical protein
LMVRIKAATPSSMSCTVTQRHPSAELNLDRCPGTPR